MGERPPCRLPAGRYRGAGHAPALARGVRRRVGRSITCAWACGPGREARPDSWPPQEPLESDGGIVVGHSPLLRQTKTPAHIRGGSRGACARSRGSTRFDARPSTALRMRASSLAAVTGRPVCPTAPGDHKGSPLRRLGVTLAGGFRRVSAGPAHSRRPGLPEARRCAITRPGQRG
jgi:hypothetical protein